MNIVTQIEMLRLYYAMDTCKAEGRLEMLHRLREIRDGIDGVRVY